MEGEKSSERFEKLLNIAEGELETLFVSLFLCLSVTVFFSFLPPCLVGSLCFFSCLSACEVKVASMVTTHSVYATTSHFITSC